MTESLAALEEIHSLTGEMLAAARARDWVTVANLETVRSALLREVFEGSVRPAPELLATAARRLLDADRELIVLGEQARDGVSAELALLRQSRKAQSEYAASGGD